MPPGQQLPAAERELIRQWIAEGAPWPADMALGSAAPGKKDEKANVSSRCTPASRASSREKSQSEMKPYKTTIPNTDVSFEMVPIPGGEFTMGTPATEAGHKKDEEPQRKVKIDPFWMGKYEVTWDEYRLFMFSQMAKEDVNKDAVVDAISRPTRPYVEMSFGMGINGYPAISMTQHAANKYAEWLSAKTGHFYRLPTEAEWEYACRAGTTTAYSFGDDASQARRVRLVLRTTADGKYGKVGKKKPNPWGLYDMHGNVMEWTLDQYDPKGYAGLGADNPWNVATQPYPHAVRGGSWMDGAAQLRCGARVGIRSIVEAAGSAVAEEHLVSHGCAGTRLPARAPIEGSDRGTDVQVLEQRCSRRTVMSRPRCVSSLLHRSSRANAIRHPSRTWARSSGLRFTRTLPTRRSRLL